MPQLLTLERVVLESISKGHNRLNSIQTDVGLQLSLVLSILSKLMKKGYITLNQGSYQILDNELAWKKASKKENVKEEIHELSESLVNNYFSNPSKNCLKVQKIYLSESDEKIFGSLLYNLETFIVSLRKDQREKGIRPSSKDQKVIMWGYSNYQNILEDICDVV